jgi:DNA repair protein RecN (Recombination protein N)
LRSTEENIKRKDDIARLIEISEGPISQELESINSKLVKANENSLAVPLGKINELMKELAFQASVLLEKIQSDADQEEDLLQKVDEFNRILNKHRRTSQEELKKLQHELEGRAKDLEELRGEIKIQETLYSKKELELKNESKNLNKKRREALPLIQKEIDAGLLALKLEGSVLCFDCIETDTLNVRAGIDLNILFSANRGMEAIPIQKAASGGELSRVMLLLQQLISTRLAMPSILFDEIDTGVSGEVAEKIGKLLKEMGKGRQLYAITHLPQVAAQAENHLRVEKQDINGKVSSTVIELQGEDRVEEIARLMSGEEINEAAKQNARKLMGHGA